MSKKEIARIRRIILLATPIWERTEEDPSGHDIKQDQALRSRTERWIEVLGSPDRLRHRLAVQERELTPAHALLRQQECREKSPLPSWSSYLIPIFQQEKLSQKVSSLIVHPQESSFEQAFPFYHIVQPLLQFARSSLVRQAGRSLGLLQATARQDIDRQLLQHLCFLTDLSLGQCFEEFKVKTDPLAFLLPQRDTEGSSLYQSFVKDMLSQGGLARFLERFPVLARLIGLSLEQWASHVATLCQRLHNDLEKIRQAFNWNDETGEVAHLKIDLSDRHQGGQTVVELGFQSGRKLIYKPRSLAAESAFYKLVKRLNQKGLKYLLHTPQFLDCSSYGWAEFVAHRPCRNPSEVRHYYFRSGMLLALLYALRTRDIHCENLIAHGEHPVVVDLETMLQADPVAPTSREMEGGKAAVEWVIRDSVLSTGFLPNRQVGPDGQWYDWSGLYAEAQQLVGAQRSWTKVNTDGMEMDAAVLRTTLQQNSVVLEGEVEPASAYLEELIDGFEFLYQCLVRQRERLLDPTGPLESLRKLSLRTLIRSTATYSQLHAHLLHPEFLRNGLDRSIELEVLARSLGNRRGKQEAIIQQAIYQAEIAAMERLDIPMFSARADENKLESDGDMLAPAYFQKTGFEAVCQRLKQLNAQDLDQQVGNIRLAFYTHNWKPAGQAKANGSFKPLHRETCDFQAAALAIGKKLKKKAVRGVNGAVSWLALRFNFENEAFHIESMPYDLYSGQCGLALFFAALSQLEHGSKSPLGFCRKILLDIRAMLDQAVLEPEVGQFELGGASGLGGLIYTLVLLSKWEVEAGLLGDAHRAIRLFTTERIQKDQAFGLISGLGGGILGLLSLAETGDELALERAVACGDQLLKGRIQTGTGHRAWPAKGAALPLLGLGHGAAGIAYALLRLAEASGNSQFREAALEALDYEAQMFVGDCANWPDLRQGATPSGDQAFMTAWCHGAPGIGLARLAGLNSYATQQIYFDIDQAVKATLAFPMDGPDHVCCGNLGRIEFLLEAGRKLKRPDLVDEARRRAAWVVARANRQSHYVLQAQVPLVYACPSFFQGLAGIGYSLLRLKDPTRFPCVLFWE